MYNLSLVLFACLLAIGCASRSSAHDESLQLDLVMIDARGLVNQVDTSGLAAGQHVIELTAYVPKARKWTGQDTERVKSGVRVRRLTPVPSFSDAKVDLLEVEGRDDMRSLKLTLDLDGPGSWYIEIRGTGLGEVNSDAQGIYEFTDAMTLPGSQGSPYAPATFIRTVGSCRHPVAVMHRFNAEGQPVGWSVRFSEPTTQAPTAAVTAKQADGAEFNVPFSVLAKDNGVTVDVNLPMQWSPNLASASSVWKLPVPAADNIAGSFSTSFTCGTGEGEIRLITWIQGLPENVMPKSYFVAPLAEAVTFGKSKPLKTTK